MSDSHSSRKIYSWSNLPPELLATIFDRLSSSDTSKARSICKSWCAAVPPPLLCLNPTLTPGQIVFDKDDDNHKDVLRDMGVSSSFRLVNTAVYILRPKQQHHDSASRSACWLVAVEQSYPDKLRLLHPLTRRPIDFTTLPTTFPKLISGFDAVELSKGFNVRYFDGINPINTHPFSKLLWWPNPYNDSLNPAYAVLMMRRRGELSYVQMSKKRESWKIYDAGTRMFDDIVHCTIDQWNGMVLAIHRTGQLFGIEYDSMEITTVLVRRSYFDAGSNYQRRLRLLIWENELFLISRTSTKKSCCIEVLKLNQIRYQWEPVYNLENKVLFISIDSCFFVKAKDIPGAGVPENCVVFSKSCFPNHYGCNLHDDVLFQGRLNDYIGQNFKLISSFPSLLKLMWPPPDWASEQVTK